MKISNIVAATCLGLLMSIGVESAYATDLKTQLAERYIARDLSVIRSYADIEKLKLSESPFNLLSESSKERFVESLVFNEKGLVGFSYSDLEAELTPSQIYTLLSYFGAQHLASMMTNARIETSTDLLIIQSASDLKEHSKPVTPMGRPSADHKGYACSERATCRESAGAICMSSC